MKRVAVTCVFELTYNDHVDDDDIILDINKHYVNTGYLVGKYQEAFNIVQIEVINE